MALAAQRDILQGTNLNKGFSILSYSYREIADRASRLGVSLGTDEKQILASAKMIKDSEVERTLTILQNNLNQKENGQPHCLILNRASSLTEDLEGDDNVRDLEDQMDASIISERVKKTRKKKVYSYVTKRRSNRIKIQKKNRDA